MPFISQKRKIGFKLESTAYTAETLTSTSFDFRAKNVSYTPEIQSTARKYASGDFSAFSAIAGKRMITITFSVDLAPSAAGGATEPEYSDILKACAMKGATSGSGYRWTTNSDECKKPATIWVVEEGCGASETDLAIKARGCMGNATFVLDSVGSPVRIDFEFKGAFDSVADVAAGSLVPAGFDLSEPNAVLSATITAFTEAQTIDTMNVNLGNQVEMVIDPSKSDGYLGALVVNRDPTITFDPYLESITSRANYNRFTAGITGSFSATIGSGAKRFVLSAPAFQITGAYGAGDRNGVSTNAISGILTRNAGEDEFALTQGVGA